MFLASLEACPDKPVSCFTRNTGSCSRVLCHSQWIFDTLKLFDRLVAFLVPWQSANKNRHQMQEKQADHEGLPREKMCLSG